LINILINSNTSYVSGGNFNSMLNRIINKILDLRSGAVYRTALLKHARKLPFLEERDRSILDALKQEGIYVTTLQELDLPATPGLLNASSELLPSMGMASDSKPDQNWPEIYTVTDLPDFYNWGKEQRLLNIIENYIGLPVSYHGVHLRKDFPNEKQFGTLLWHRDSEDRNILKIIIYLSDVAEEHGPFEYIPRSLTSIYQLSYYHIQYKLWRARRSYCLGISNEVLDQIIPRSDWKSCPGPAGTVIFVDTGVLFHHGTLRTQERSAQFFVYTAKPPKRPELCSQYWDNTFPKPDLRQESESIQSST
jgi:hypothetical protein